MDFGEAVSARARAALSHVAARSAGPAVGPRLRITLDFHPDRSARGGPVLARLARDATPRTSRGSGTSWRASAPRRARARPGTCPRIQPDAATSGTPYSTPAARGGQTPGTSTPSA